MLYEANLWAVALGRQPSQLWAGAAKAGNDCDACCSAMERAKDGPREPLVDDKRDWQVNAHVAMRQHGKASCRWRLRECDGVISAI